MFRATFTQCIRLLLSPALILLMSMPISAQTQREAHPQAATAFPSEWWVFGPIRQNQEAWGRAIAQLLEADAVPEGVTLDGERIKTQQITFEPAEVLDLGKELGGFKVGDAAYLFAIIESEHIAAPMFGAGADWWMTWWVNGQVVYDTSEEGNIGWPLSVTDHRFKLPLRAGRNLVCVRVVSGSNSFTIKAGAGEHIQARLERIQAQHNATFTDLDNHILEMPVQTDQGLLLSRIAGERASQGVGNKIVTHDGKTHIVWQDSLDTRYFGRVRTFDHATGQWSPTVTLAEGVDEHARPTIVADSQVYLHMVMGGHNTPLQYRRSVKPNDTSQWTPNEPFGHMTYPLLLCGSDDTLILMARPRTHEGMVLWTKAPDDIWRDQGMLVRRPKRFSGYTAMNHDMAWGPDH